MCHLCLGCRPYNRWSHFWFSDPSMAQLTRFLGRRCMRMLLNLVIDDMSRGRPWKDILLISQAPSRMLRNVCQRECKQWQCNEKLRILCGIAKVYIFISDKLVVSTIFHHSPVSLTNVNAIFHFLSHLLRRSANLYCDVSSRIADANHHHPLSSESIRIFIFPTVKTLAGKRFMSWRDTGDATKSEGKTHFLAKI